MIALLQLFYVENGEEGASSAYSRTAEKKTLIMHYVLIVALMVEGFEMKPDQVRPRTPPLPSPPIYAHTSL